METVKGLGDKTKSLNPNRSLGRIEHYFLFYRFVHAMTASLFVPCYSFALTEAGIIQYVENFFVEIQRTAHFF